MKKFILLLFIVAFNYCHAQQPVIELYKGIAPGSEKWTWSEKSFITPNSTVLYDVSRPAIEIFLPPDSLATGASVIVCPGGGFCLLEIEGEGREIARWLNSKGIAAFVLKYRVMKTHSNDPQSELFEKARNTDQLAVEADSVINMAIADVQTAMVLLKATAGSFKIHPNKIGILGFSAGGTLAAAMAYNYSEKTRPAFVAALYPWIKPIRPKVVQKDAPPIFVSAASDDQLGFHIESTGFYLDWSKAGKPAELHLYAEGGHGFQAYKTIFPAGSWKDRFLDWLSAMEVESKK